MDDSQPLFVRDFRWAVIRLATFFPAHGEAARLLFATVSLLVADRPPPLKMVGVEHCKIGKSQGKVFFRRVVLTAKDAIRWYRTLAQTQKTPVPSRGEDREDDKDGIPIIVPALIDEPIWPGLGLPTADSLLSRASGKSNPVPFASPGARVHRRFGSDEGFESILGDSKALSFIKRRLHVNLHDYPEYLGSVALIVPDLIIKKVDCFLIHQDGVHGEQIFYRFVPRPGKTLENLRVTLFDEQALLLSGFESHEVPEDGIIVVDKGYCSGIYGYVVTHPVYGVLIFHPPSSFARMITFAAHIVEQTRIVQAPRNESANTPIDEYRVDRTGSGEKRTIGSELNIPTANARVYQAVARREKHLEGVRYDQRWFADGQRKEAMDFVRSRVGQAQHRILVADPYFGWLQVLQYLFAVRSTEVGMTILTSELAFKGSRKSSALHQKNKILGFANDIERLKDYGNQSLEVNVIPGKSPVLHDRFLVVDDNAWFLGNSLNALGDRASLIIRLPDPDQVITELEKMLAQAEPFESYKKRTLAKLTKRRT